MSPPYSDGETEYNEIIETEGNDTVHGGSTQRDNCRIPKPNPWNLLTHIRVKHHCNQKAVLSIVGGISAVVLTVLGRFGVDVCLAGGSVIADYTSPIAYTGTTSEFHVNLDAVSRSQLTKIPNEDCTGSTFILGHYFHHSVSDGVALLCVTNSNEDPDLPRRFLIELRSLCTPQIINNTSKRSELLTRILSRLVNDYNDTSNKLKSIETSLQETTQTLRGSITSILERGELIDSIVSKSSALKDETVVFRKAANRANSSILRRIVLVIADGIFTKEFAIGISITAVLGLGYFFILG